MNILNNQDFDKLYSEFNDSTKPFRYVVIDNFFKDSVIDKLHKEFPEVTDDRWVYTRPKFYGKPNIFEKKMYAISVPENLPEYWYEVIMNLNSKSFCEYTSKFTDINGLLPDEHNDIGQWSGIRYMAKGSKQLIHSDARLHPHTKLEKKITVVGYLNKKWNDEDDGCIEIWNNDLTKCVDRILPLYNRITLFENTDKSYHGVPVVNKGRKSFMMTLVKRDDSFEEIRPKAKFVKRPNEDDEKLFDELAEIRAKLTDY